MSLNLKFCSFDLETTGTNSLLDRIVTASCLDIDVATGEKTPHNWLANPGVPIPEAASSVHGITTEKAEAEGHPHREVVQEIVEHINNAWDNDYILVVYNAAFDLSMLHVLSNGDFTINGPVLDPLVLDRGFDKYRRGSRKLIDVAQHYGVPLTEDEAHGAEADSLAAARIAYKMFYVYPELHTMDVMSQQELWAAEQTRGLKTWLESQGKTFDGSYGWPIREDARAEFH